MTQELSRVTGVLTDPTRAFADIATGPRWWVPLTLLAILALAFTMAFTQHVGWERFMNQTFDSNPKTQAMPAEQRAAAIEKGAKIAPIFGYVGAIVGTPVYALLVALGLMLVFNLTMSAQLRFAQAFGMTSYALLPGVISTGLAILVMFLKNPDDFNLRNPLVFNAGAFLDPQATPKWLLSLASSIDLFNLWTVLLLALAFGAIARKLSFRQALTGVASAWLVVILVKSAWAGLMG